ncbi:MAG: outer rane lipid asymmetry maintenance protein MlaD [Gammaproteobacteria bacterium]|nr:outer rane lipid asymmetry maintenance protein MlaD [Gammaproteobacteria bacterium]
MDIWVGIFVAIGIGATVFVALRVANLASSTSEATYQVTAEFSNIGGLKVRAPVKSAGVVVGRVTDITLDTQKYVAMVSMNLEQRYPFSQDTSASILTSGLLGEQYVGLESGAESENLTDGGKITLTSSALVLESLISEFLLDKASE